MNAIKSFLIITILILASFSAGSTVAQEVEQEDSGEWIISRQDLKHAKDANYWASRDRWIDANQHAKKSEDKLVSKIFRWLKYYHGSKYTKFSEVSEFLDENPTWPEQNRLKRAQELAIDVDIKAKNIVAWYTIHKDAKSERRKFKLPYTVTGKRILAEAIIGMGKTVSRQNKNFISGLIYDVWINGDFSRREDISFLEKHGAILKEKHHEARIERLLWARKASDAKRMLSKISDKNKRKVYDARIKLQLNKYGLDRALRSISKKYAKDEGLLYDRAKWRMKRSTADGVISLLKQVPKNTKYPKKWWKIKKRYLGKLIDNKKYEDAYNLAKNHGFIENVFGLADAEWEAGWIAYFHQKDPRKAYRHFYNMFSRVQTPISLGRASYWAARMAEMNRNKTIAKKWYSLSSQYSSSFYGQLATEKLGKATLNLPYQIVPTTADYESYYSNELLKVAYILNRLGRYKEGRKFVLEAMRQNDSLEEQVLITQFGAEIGRLDYGVIAAKSLARSGDAIDIINNYPIIDDLVDVKNNKITAPEESLIHAIILQESIFDNTAKSYVGATGLMQLMPATAKEVARKNKLRYSKKRLKEVKYNLTLGSSYLNSMIKRFDGSYILAIAAYNGGQGNVRKWIRANGDPRKMQTTEKIIDWIEKIPFSETKNYVQRVVENLQIYRYKINESSQAFVHTAKDLSR